MNRIKTEHTLHNGKAVVKLIFGYDAAWSAPLLCYPLDGSGCQFAVCSGTFGTPAHQNNRNLSPCKFRVDKQNTIAI
jgi:hypothetical protein